MKAWIIYDSVHGHCKKLGETVGDLLEGIGEIYVGDARKITPSDVITDSPDAVIVGGPVRFGKPSTCITTWIKRCHQLENKSGFVVQKGCAFCTWKTGRDPGTPWEVVSRKYPYARTMFQHVLSVKVLDEDAPLMIADNVQVYDFVENLKRFLLQDDDDGKNDRTKKTRMDDR